MDQNTQDDGLVKSDLRNFERLESERAPWESLWQDIDDYFPDGSGGFTKTTPGAMRGSNIFDSTHITACGRFSGLMKGLTVPENKQYIQPQFSPELMKSRAVQEWCDEAGPRLKAIRHAIRTGFGVSTHEHYDQIGRYGTGLVWTSAESNRGLIYRALHLSECYIDTDHAGLVDTVFRAFEKSARECEQMFGEDALTPKMRDCLSKPGKEHDKFQLLHIVTPNTEWDQEKLDWRSMPIASRYLAVDEKSYLRRAGFHTMPIICHRHMTSPMEKYGRSPAMKVMGNIAGVNAMRRTTLRAGHKIVDPALAFFDDDGITGLATKPGGMNPNLVSEDGRLLIARMPGGENGIPYAMEMENQERETIKGEFLEDVYKIALDPNSRMTTVEVYEATSKLALLVEPYSDRYRQEMMGPQTDRDLDLALRAGQIAPFPPEVVEAGAWPSTDYDNPIAAMARADEVAGIMRMVETATPFMNIDPTVRHYFNLDEIMPILARGNGVRTKTIRTAEQVAQLVANEKGAEEQAAGIEGLGTTAGAFLDIAKANQIAEAA